MEGETSHSTWAAHDRVLTCCHFSHWQTAWVWSGEMNFGYFNDAVTLKHIDNLVWHRRKNYMVNNGLTKHLQYTSYQGYNNKHVTCVVFKLNSNIWIYIYISIYFVFSNNFTIVLMSPVVFFNSTNKCTFLGPQTALCLKEHLFQFLSYSLWPLKKFLFQQCFSLS